MKTCKICNETKSIDYFYSSSMGMCKHCHKKYSAEKVRERVRRLPPKKCKDCNIEIKRRANLCDDCRTKKRREDKKRYSKSPKLKRLGIFMLNKGCIECGWKEARCDLHHINGRQVDDKDGLWNISYLCPNCHRLAHDGKLIPRSLEKIAALDF